ncbi:MAG: type I-C CRISPR-associated protein Cas8c/Csd1 [Deltaproteobacteria bacterium]|nr:type I-C CRISPR-associated protein Cas8c/Csd1 [Deltaproteobacteria bacterium]
MLHHILKYAETRGLAAEVGFSERPLKWLIAFDDRGENPEVIPLGDDKKGQLQAGCPHAGTKAQGKDGAHFLVDKLSTVILYQGTEVPTLITPKFETFVDFLQRGSPFMQTLSTAANALSSPANRLTICKKLKHLNAKKGDFATLRIGPVSLVDAPNWHDWWRNEFRIQRSSPVDQIGKKKKGNSFKMRCLITGNLVTPVERHEGKIQGLKGVGGRGGDSLISFDKDAYRSYGLVNAFNAATSQETAKVYVTALNDLLKKHRVSLGNSYIVYWFKQAIEGTENDPLSWIQTSGEKEFADAMDQVTKILESISTGRRPDLLTNEFYAMLVSGAPGRVMVRDWHEGPLRELILSLQAWFDDLAITSISGDKVAKWSSFERIVTALLPLKKFSQEYADWIKPIGAFSRVFWRAAICREPFPQAVLGRIVPLLASHMLALAEEERRRPSERSQDYPALLNLVYRRMALIKAYFIRKGDDNMKPYLNPEHPHSAYHCGRLLAVFARLQRAALGDVGAGVVQRYYTAASQTPGLILGRLAANAKNHLGKLESGQFDWEDQIAEIMGRIKDVVPRTLTLEEQSLFALGYYQQIASLNAG